MGALGDPYVTLEELKVYLQIAPEKLVYDQRLNDARNSASREVEQFCGRQFNRDEIASTRMYQPESDSLVVVDDFYTTQDLVIESEDYYDPDYMYLVDEYQLFPLSGVVDGRPGWPYGSIRADEHTFPWYGRRAHRGIVHVTARWGWETVPSNVKQATFLLAGQTFKLAEAPFGVTGMDQFGVVRVRDLPQVASKLNRFVTTPIMIG